MKSSQQESELPGLAVALAAAKLAPGKPTILVAEDNSDGRDMLQVLLALKGYNVLLAADGLEAVEVALAQFPDLILLDLELPQLDGLAVTKNLRRHPKFKEVPIVVLSGHDPRKYRQSALDAGCSDYLFKPIDFERLEEILIHNVPTANGRERDV